MPPYASCDRPAASQDDNEPGEELEPLEQQKQQPKKPKKAIKKRPKLKLEELQVLTQCPLVLLPCWPNQSQNNRVLMISQAPNGLQEVFEKFPKWFQEGYKGKGHEVRRQQLAQTQQLFRPPCCW